MARITNATRKQIVARLMEHRFATEEAALQNERSALGDAVYRDIYPRKVITQMSALPDGWLPERGGFYVQFGTSGSRFSSVSFGSDRRVQGRHACQRCVKAYPDDHPLSRRYSELRDKADGLSAARSEAKRKASAMLTSITTIKRLVEVWPEVAPFVKDFGDDGSKTVPAIPVADLNKALNLPRATKRVA